MVPPLPFRSWLVLWASTSSGMVGAVTARLVSAGFDGAVG